jgi:chitodextrinase
MLGASCLLGLGGCSSGSSTTPPPPDTTSPTAPANLMATATLATSVNLTWTASTDNVGVAQYKVERCQGAACANFAQIATPAASTFNDTGLTASTAYSYRVRAADAAGNNSTYSNVFSATTPASTDTTPPTAPTNLTATAASSSQINLAWTASTDNVGVTGYKVERCSGSGCANFTQIATPTGTTFNNTGLTASTSYSYRVRANDAAGNNSGFSNTSSATTPAGADTTPPTAPTNLTATAASSSQINLAWTASTDNVGVTGYKVERCSGSGCATFTQVATPTGTTFNDTGLTASTSYSYRVRATDAAGNNSGYSSTSSATTPAGADTTPPTAPTNLTATAASSSQINLAWTASTDNVGVTGYKVERCSGSGCTNFTQIATPTGTTFNNTGLTASTSYSYRVRANDAAGNNSSYSNTATTSTSATGNISVTISPRRGGITTAQALTISATVKNDVGAAGVMWSTTGGTLTGQTLTGAKFSSTTPGAFTITAKSNADNTQSVAATIGVTDLTAVATYHNNISRDGTNPQEYALTASNVNSSSFGKLFACAVDGEVYAQPLWVANVAIGGGNHNVIFAATENDSVYAFDADASPCKQYWKTTFLGTGITPIQPGDTGEAGDINTMIGITGTPVIDPVSQTLYVVAKTKEPTGYHQRLHALSLIAGTEKFNGPLDLTDAITVPGNGDTGDSSVGCQSTSGNVPFCPLRAGQRAGLALVNGFVYVAWASHGDQQPYHGWIMRFLASDLSQPPVLYNDSPNGREGGIWMSGGAPAFDSSNNLFVITGNGDYDGVTEFGDSFLKLNNSLVVQDWFTPSVQSTLDGADLDLGSGGAVILVDIPTSTFPHVLIGGGKGTSELGQIYVVNRDTMGKNASSDKSVQQFDLGGMIYSTAAFWQNTLYIAGVGTKLKAFALNGTTSTFNTTPTSVSTHTFGFPGTTPAISSAGTTSGTGIVWALDTNSTTAGNASGSNGPAALFAYDVRGLNTLLYSSDTTIGAPNAAGNAVKFCVPTVANGKVYVGTQTEITVFGLLP